MRSLQGVLIALVLSSASAQFFFGNNFGAGGNVGAGGGFRGSDTGGSFFDGAQRNDFFNNARLNAQGNDRAALNAFDQTALQQDVAAQNAFGDQLFANQNFATETVGNEAGFVDVDAGQASRGDRTVDISIIDQQAFDVGDQVSASQGFRNNFGARDFGNSQFGAQNNGFDNVRAGNNVQSFDGLQADAAQDFGLNANQGVNQASQQRAQGRDFFGQEAGANGGAFEGVNFGGFGNVGGFGRRK